MTERITVKDINDKVKDIEDYVERYGSKKLTLLFEKGSQTNGISHKVFKKNQSGDFIELFRAKTTKDLYKKLEGYEIGIREFWYFRQR